MSYQESIHDLAKELPINNGSFLITGATGLIGSCTLNAEAAYKDADFVVIAAPTNYDSKKNFFDTSAVEAVIKGLMK